MSITNPKQTITVDPEFEALIPPLTEDEFKQLRENILDANEVYDPLITWNGVLIDGHNRWRIIQEHPEISYKTTEVIFLSRNEAIVWIIKNQLGRRNLPTYERARLTLRCDQAIAEQAKEQQGKRTDIQQKSAESFTPINTNNELAKIAGVSHDTIAKVKKIEAKASPEVKEQLRKGKVSINRVYNEIREEERAAEPPKPVAPVEPPKPPQFTITDLRKEVESNGENFIRLLRDTLTRRSTLYSEAEDKAKVRDEITKIKVQIEALENLLK